MEIFLSLDIQATSTCTAGEGAALFGCFPLLPWALLKQQLIGAEGRSLSEERVSHATPRVPWSLGDAFSYVALKPHAI